MVLEVTISPSGYARIAPGFKSFQYAREVR